MGRKIPAKKHRGIKDPLVQQAKRLQSLKSKINAPPNDPDEQPVPRSLTQLFAFQERGSRDKKSHSNKPIKRLSHPRGENVRGAGTCDNPVSRMRRGAGEGARAFSLRINSAVRALHAPTQSLQDLADDMEAEDAKGERMAAHRERRARKQRRRERTDPAAPATPATAPRPSKVQRLALKKKEKKLKAIEASKEKQEVVYERVSFGEVCDAPPTLHFAAKGRAAGGVSAPRPGRRDLLLTKMLKPRAPAPAAPSASSRPAPLPPAEVARLERARASAVAAYRALRADTLKAKLALKAKRA